MTDAARFAEAPAVVTVTSWTRRGRQWWWTDEEGVRWYLGSRLGVPRGHGPVVVGAPRGRCRRCGLPAVSGPSRGVHVDPDEGVGAEWRQASYACQLWAERFVRRPLVDMEPAATEALVHRLWGIPWVRALGCRASWGNSGEGVVPPRVRQVDLPAPPPGVRRLTSSSGRYDDAIRTVLLTRLGGRSRLAADGIVWTSVVHEVAHAVTPDVDLWLRLGSCRTDAAAAGAEVAAGAESKAWLHRGNCHSSMWAAVHLWLLLELGEARYAREMARLWRRYMGPLPTPETVFGAVYGLGLDRHHRLHRPFTVRSRARFWAAAAGLSGPVGPRALRHPPWW